MNKFLMEMMKRGELKLKHALTQTEREREIKKDTVSSNSKQYHFPFETYKLFLRAIHLKGNKHLESNHIKTMLNKMCADFLFVHFVLLMCESYIGAASKH